MTPGMIMFAVGVVLLCVSVVLVFIFAVTEKKRRKKLEQYLNEQY